MKEIVIELNDTTYESLTSPSVVIDFATIRNLIEAIVDGKVLPKGHGRLIDIDKAIETEEVFHKYFHVAINPLYGRTIGCTAPSVIEADKGEE